KDGFIGRDAALAEREGGKPPLRLVTLEVDADDADASGYEPVFADGSFVGYVTSGAYGHTVGKSLALAYVDSAVADDRPMLTVDVIGRPRPARIIPASPHDPSGARMRQ